MSKLEKQVEEWIAALESNNYKQEQTGNSLKVEIFVHIIF